jgi:hypothetical protein
MLCGTKMLFLYKLIPARQFMPLFDWCYLWTILICVGYGHMDSAMSMNKETERMWKETCTRLSSVGLSDTTVFFHIDKQHDFWKKGIEHKMCVLIFSTTFIWNISHFKKNRARYDQNGGHVQYPLFLSDFNESWIFWAYLRKILKYPISLKSKLFHADGQTDMTLLTVAFCNFPNVPKNCQIKIFATPATKLCQWWICSISLDAIRYATIQ